MIATLWRKHWMELRGIWTISMLVAILPAIAFALIAEQHPAQVARLVHEFIYFFAFLALGMFPVRFAGTGLGTSKGFRPARGPDPTLLFTLALPARRRTLFFYRTGFCLLVMESLAVLGLVVGAIVFAHWDGSMRVFADGLWILLLMVPLYFLDSLLSIRFDPFSITQVQILSAMVLWFGSPLVGANPRRIAAALSGIAPIPFVLITLAVAAGLAAVTVWRLDRHDY